MSYEEARKDRKRSRRNSQINGLLMALSQVGGMMNQNRLATKKTADQRALADLAHQRNLERDAANNSARDARADASRKTQLDVAGLYANSRSGGKPTGLEFETMGWDAPEIQAERDEIDAILNDPDRWEEHMGAAERLKVLGRKAQRRGVQAWKEKQNDTGGNDLDTASPDPAASISAPGGDDNYGPDQPEPGSGFLPNTSLESMMPPQGTPVPGAGPGGQPIQAGMQPAAGPMPMPGMMAPQMPNGQQPSGGLPPAPGVSGRGQAQYGNIRDALQRMMAGHGSPMDEMMMNEFFGYSIMPGPPQPNQMQTPFTQQPSPIQQQY